MFQLDLQGKCETCLATAKDTEMIRCDTCKFHFHAICDSTEGSNDGIAKKTHLGLHKQASTKKNFIWKCDRCMTISEHNEAATVKEMIQQLIERFTHLETNLPQQIKASVKEEVQNIQSQTPDLDKLSETIATKISDPTMATKWNNPKQVEEMKASLLIKADSDGNSVDTKKVKKIIMDNGVPVNKVVVSSTGDTFINLPDQKSRDKLQPLLKSEKNEVVSLKAKLPAIKILDVRDELTRDEIKDSLINQNEAIGTLVREHGQELEVIYTRPPPAGKWFHQITVRVSPRIRKVIKDLGDKVFLCSKSCNVADSFHIRRCNKCQTFGHYAEKCRGDTPVVCGYCAAHHQSSECIMKSSASHHHKCANCESSGIAEFEGHSTFSKDCPAYKIQQKKLEASVAYDYKYSSGLN